MPTERLTITREISRSAITTVAEGYDASLDRKVLVKSIHPQYVQESDLRARLEREARAIARISHPNVVQIFDLIAGELELALVLEFVEGSSLGKLVKDRGEFPPEVAVTIALYILSGLEVAHNAGIIHRDLKPDNVLLSSRGEVKITDFGLATLADQPSVTLEGMVIGTPSYMSPEQASGAAVTARSDLFAVGLMLFEMLTGERVIAGGTIHEAFQNALKYQPPKLENYRGKIPELIEPILRRLLEKSPERRPETAADARKSLAEVLQDGPLPAALLADYFSGGLVQRASQSHVARKAAWTRPLRASVLAVTVIGLIVLVVHYATKLSVDITGKRTDDQTTDSLAKLNPDSGAEASHEDSTGTAGSEPVSIDTAIASVIRPERSDSFELARRLKPDTTGLTPATSRAASLFVVTRPWARVFLGDSLIGNTPLASSLMLAAGTHTLTFLNPEIGQPITRTIQLRSAAQDTLDLNLYDFVARLRVTSVKPWADLYVDDEFVLRTPSSQTIFRPLGTHRITLKHPDYPPYESSVTFKQGDPTHEIRHDFTEL